jgi:16S rRNA (guanine(966)-N(2))-methyltransferase RsmD
MRVISGTARGKKLGELEGMETRPTTDRVKEGIFNIIQFQVQGAVALDLFAGTGQLGIECLSRGAEKAVFVEQRKDALALIRKNLADTRLTERAQVVSGEALSYLAGCKQQFDLVFLDPPYATNLLENALEKIAAIDILSKAGIIICESRPEKSLPDVTGSLEKQKEYRYGKIKVTTYRRNDAQ